MSERCTLDAETKPGARPIRMRGYYRAVKRGEAWAVKIASIKNPFSKMLSLYFRNTDFGPAMKESFFAKHIKELGSGWSGGAYLSVPIFKKYAKRKRAKYRNSGAMV